MKRSSASPRRRVRKPNRHDLQTDTSDQEYRVGPGRPPKEYQFKPGQSGNPEGARRKPRSIAPDLKALFERALSTKVTLRQGEKERIISKAAAGIEQLVNQFAKGDRHARRDLLILAQTLGVDLAAGEGDIGQAVAAALSANDEALLADYVRRHSSGLFPGAHAVTFSSTGERRLPKGFYELRSQVLSLARPQRHLSYELAHIRNRTSA